MREPGGTGGTATTTTTTTTAPPPTTVQPAERDGDYGYGAGLPTLTSLISTGAIPPTPQITEKARRMKAAIEGTLPELPLFVRRDELGPPEPGHTRVPRGISLWGDQELLTDVVFETVDAVVRDGPIRNVDLADPDAARTVQMVLEDVIWRGPDVVRWRRLGCVEEDDEGPAWVRPAPPAAIAMFLGLIPESVCKERSGRTYRDRPDLAPPGVAKLKVDGEGRVSGLGLWRRKGALPPPDRALSSWEAHDAATHMLGQLELGRMRVFAGYKPPLTRRASDGKLFEAPFRMPISGEPDTGADYPEPPSYISRGTTDDELTLRITQVIAARLDDVVYWKNYGAMIDGRWRCPAPPDWIASMLLIGPRAREAYALQRGRRVLGPERSGQERGNFPHVSG
jgi:hypothetical protein